MNFESCFVYSSPPSLLLSLPPFLSQTLERVSAGYKTSYQEAKAQYNANKNRFPDKLPSECPAMLLCVCLAHANTFAYNTPTLCT